MVCATSSCPPHPPTRTNPLLPPSLAHSRPSRWNNTHTQKQQQALALLATGDMEGCSATLSAQAHVAARTALDAWNALFETLIAKYRDGYKVRWIGWEGVSRIGREGLVGGWLGASWDLVLVFFVWKGLLGGCLWWLLPSLLPAFLPIPLPNFLTHTLSQTHKHTQVLDMTAPKFAQEFLFYPLWWLKVSGFFNIVRLVVTWHSSLLHLGVLACTLFALTVCLLWSLHTSSPPL